MKKTKAGEEEEGGLQVLFSIPAADRQPWRGYLSTGVFITIWASSIASPLILLTLYYFRLWILFVLVGSAVAASYAPKLPRLPFLQEIFRTSMPHSFNGASISCEVAPDVKETHVMYCVHPHGVLCMGWSMLFAQKFMNHVNFLFATNLWVSPFFRLFTRLTGRPGPASADNMKRVMSKGTPVALVPGGFQEATLSVTHVDRLYLKNRAGFVKFALRYGYALTPVFAFGESKTFNNVEGGWEWRLKLNSYSIPACLPTGYCGIPIVPIPTSLNLVIGTPLKLPKIDNPTTEEVSKYHDQYVAHITALHDRYSSKFGGLKLEIW